MYTRRHALTWSAQKLGIGLAMLVGLVLFAYFILIAVVVVGQAVAGLGS